MGASGMIDELAYAGHEHLDPAYVADVVFRGAIYAAYNLRAAVTAPGTPRPSRGVAFLARH